MSQQPDYSPIAPMIAILLALCLALPSTVEASETTDKQVYRPFKKRLRRSSLTSKLAKESEAALQRSVRVFQQRYLIKRHRLELLAGGGMEFGDPMFDHYIADASLVFHLGPQWAIGITGSKFFGEERESFYAVQDHFGLFPERSMMQANGLAEVQYSPVFGKMASFGLAIYQVDAYGIGGLGMVRTTIGESLKPMAAIGAGLRLHLLRALTLSFELRSLVFIEQFQAGNALVNHLVGGLRIGLWIPPSFQYRFQR